jgi:hypothetical protein
MSMNLHLEATIEAETKLGKKEICEKFDLYQTPTEITREILARDNQLEGYKEFVLKRSEDVQVPIYEEKDFFHEKEPIGFETVNYGNTHIEELNEWLNGHDGWEIEWYEM